LQILRAAATCLAPLLIVALAAPTCSRRDPLAPPSIRLGEDICARCGMTIEDERFACAVVIASSPPESRLYDDIGDLLKDITERPPPTGVAAAMYVRDYNSPRTWLAAADATYLKSGQIKSPMESGIAAFASRAAADAAGAPGKTLSWSELRDPGPGR
jgi:copper chaperone NosL